MQKRILFSTLIVFAIASTVNGQIKKGATLLGGQLGFNASTTEPNNFPKSTTTGLTLSPAFGKAVKDNLVIGVDVLYVYTKNVNDANVSKTNAYGAGFFIRKYKLLAKDFYLFGQGRLGGLYSASKYYSTQQPGSIESKGYNIGLGFYPGLAYSVTYKLQLEAGFNNLVAVQFSHATDDNNSKSSNFGFSSSLSSIAGLTFGFRVLLN